MPALHPDVGLCAGPCDRICPNEVLSRCDWCAKPLCDDCQTTNPLDMDELLCPGCFQEAVDRPRLRQIAERVQAINRARKH